MLPIYPSNSGEDWKPINLWEFSLDLEAAFAFFLENLPGCWKSRLSVVIAWRGGHRRTATRQSSALAQSKFITGGGGQTKKYFSFENPVEYQYEP